MARAFLSLGSNLQNRGDNIKRAIRLLNDNDIKVTRVSPVYETKPVGKPTLIGIKLPFGNKQPDFLNCVVEVFTDYLPEILLSKASSIEKTLGRKRLPGTGNLPRIIDIDILFYDDKIINKPMLKIPHPQLHTRAFVLKPLSDLEPGFIHPILNKTISQLIEKIDKKGVKLWQKQVMTTSA